MTITMNFTHGAIGFDADDTLWHNETIFERVHERYRELLSHYHDAATVDATLLDTERRNVALYGYGVKGFTLSAIETAIQLTAGKISAAEIQRLIALGREMLDHPVEVFDGVPDTLAALSEKHALILITKARSCPWTQQSCVGPPHRQPHSTKGHSMAFSPCESDDRLRERVEDYEEEVAALTYDIDYRRVRIERLHLEIDELKTELERRASAANAET